MIQALIFDFDGLIFDTEGPDFLSWQEAFAGHGCELTLSTWSHCIGTHAGVFDPVGHLEEMLGRRLNRDQLRAARRARFYEILAQQPLRPGVEAYLRDAQRLGIKCAVASSATSDWVNSHLARFELLPFFQCIRCFGDGLRSKPEPDLYLAAVRGLAVPPQRALAFEDSPNGIRAAKRAGLRCVAVPNAVTRSLRLDEADLCLDSLSDMSLERLLNHLNAAPCQASCPDQG